MIGKANGMISTAQNLIGCPFICSYSSNKKFIKNDKNYREIRHPSVEYIVGEVKSVLKRHPYISSVGSSGARTRRVTGRDEGPRKAEFFTTKFLIPYWVQGILL